MPIDPRGPRPGQTEQVPATLTGTQRKTNGGTQEMPLSQDQAAGPTKMSFLRHRWVTALGAGPLGFLLGAALAATGTRDTTNEDAVAAAEQRAREAEDRADGAESRAAVDRQTADQQAAALAQRSRELDERERGLAAR